MDFRIGSIAAGLTAAATTISGAVVNTSRLGVMGAFGYTLSCSAVSVCALSVLKDPKQSTSAKIAAFSLDFFAMLAISEATCYSLGVNYLDLAQLVTYGAMSIPAALLAVCVAKRSSFQLSAPAS